LRGGGGCYAREPNGSNVRFSHEIVLFRNVPAKTRSDRLHTMQQVKSCQNGRMSRGILHKPDRWRNRVIRARCRFSYRQCGRCGYNTDPIFDRDISESRGFLATVARTGLLQPDSEPIVTQQAAAVCGVLRC